MKTRKKVKKISIKKYNNLMNKIIKKNKPFEDTMIDLLEEAAKYELISTKKQQSRNKS